MTTTKMVRGVMAMLFLVGCGDAATEANAESNAPAIQEEGSSAPASATPSDESRPDAPRPDETDGGAGGGDASTDAPKPAPADCSKRTGGALVTFNKGSEVWDVWITNEKLNLELLTASMKGTAVTISFNDVVDGVDCDGQFTWHVDAENISLDADYDPTCDALPSEVEANKSEWLKRDHWCPSKVLVSGYSQH